MSDHWTPYRFSHLNATIGGFVAQNIMRHQPALSLWRTFHGEGALGAWKFADESGVTFQQACPACSVRIGTLAKGALIGVDDYSWMRGPKHRKDCTTCRATGFVPWHPFAQQPVFTLMQEIAGL